MPAENINKKEEPASQSQANESSDVMIASSSDEFREMRSAVLEAIAPKKFQSKSIIKEPKKLEPEVKDKKTIIVARQEAVITKPAKINFSKYNFLKETFLLFIGFVFFLLFCWFLLILFSDIISVLS